MTKIEEFKSMPQDFVDAMELFLNSCGVKPREFNGSLVDASILSHLGHEYRKNGDDMSAKAIEKLIWYCGTEGGYALTDDLILDTISKAAKMANGENVAPLKLRVKTADTSALNELINDVQDAVASLDAAMLLPDELYDESHTLACVSNMTKSKISLRDALNKENLVMPTFAPLC